jgi:SAM-dependent methyltransferase
MIGGPPPQRKLRDYQSVNRQGWESLARQGCDSSQPFGEKEFSSAQYWLDPDGWINWRDVRQVLCLAAGGGQQAPMFAGLDCRVVSADLCPEQLNRDLRTARRLGLDIECIEADMLDLSILHGRDFDLVYQAVSACYVPDVRRLYAEVASVLRPGGYYRVEHWNPVSMQLADDQAWTGRGYELIRPCVSGRRYIWKELTENGKESTECWHYMHSLTDLIGGLCEAGFRILHFSERGQEDENSEPGSEGHAHSFVRPFFCLYAEKSQDQV